jgi:hypothetical protein
MRKALVKKTEAGSHVLLFLFVINNPTSCKEEFVLLTQETLKPLYEYLQALQILIQRM